MVLAVDQRIADGWPTPSDLRKCKIVPAEPVQELAGGCALRYARQPFTTAVPGFTAALMTCRSTFPPRPRVGRAAASGGQFGARRRCGFVARAVGVALLVHFALQGVVQSADSIDLPVRTIGGEELVVPAALPAGAFLIVGFTRRSQGETQPWREAIVALGASAPPVFSVYVLEAAPRWVRGMIVRGIRREKSPEEYASVLVAAQDEAGWRSLVGFQEALEHAAYVVRVDGSGQPCFRYAGSVTDEALHSGLVAECAR